MNRQGFSLIELVFVIVILAILSAIAIPNFSVTRDDAIIAKGRSEVSKIKNAILLDFSKKLITGHNSYPSSLDSATYNTVNEKLFTTVLTPYPIFSNNTAGHWLKTEENTYTYTISQNATVTFSYESQTGIFDCEHIDANPNCRNLTQ